MYNRADSIIVCLVLVTTLFAGVAGSGAKGMTRDDLIASFQPRGAVPRALRLTEDGILPRPEPRLINEVDFQKALAVLGLKPLRVRDDGRVLRWEISSGQDRVESVEIRAARFPTAIGARESFLNRGNEAVVVLAVGDYIGSARKPGEETVSEYQPEAPFAGDVADTGSGGGFGFVRNNYVVQIFAQPIVAGQSEHPDEVTGEKVRELAKKIDQFLLKSPAQEIEDEWLPRIEAVTVELPGPVVGRPFRLDARVSLHGKPCPTGRLRVDWSLYRRQELPRETYAAKDKKQPGPTSVLYTVDRPGWWVVYCDVSYDGSPKDSRELLIYISPAEEEPATTK